MVPFSRLRLRSGHLGSWAVFLQRLSGLALALFLPAHFALLGTAIDGAAGLERSLDWTRAPAVRIAEVGLVVVLALHLGGGMRLLALEFLGWHRLHQRLFALACAFATLSGAFFAHHNF